jgi:hypothetical protein
MAYPHIVPDRVAAARTVHRLVVRRIGVAYRVPESVGLEVINGEVAGDRGRLGPQQDGSAPKATAAGLTPRSGR